MKRCVIFPVIGILANFMANANSIDMVGQTVTRFRVPDYDENNNLKTLLLGDFAKVMADGVIEITGLKLEVYQEGKVAMTITAPNCRYHQKEGMALSDGDVQIANDEMVVTGKGFEWSNREEVFKIHSQTRVVLRSGHQAMNLDSGEEP